MGSLVIHPTIMRLPVLIAALVIFLGSTASAQLADPPSAPAVDPASPAEKRWQSLATGMPFEKVAEIMGKPSRIDDLQTGFSGLSPTEDGFMMRNRSRLGRRAVWYLKKVGTTPNLNDVWVAAYFAKSDDTLIAKLSNPPERR